MGFWEKDEKEKKAETEERELSPEEQAKSRLRGFLEILIELVIVAAVVFLVLRFVAFRSVVQGDSMNATLQNGDNLVVERVSYYFHEPRRYDIVVFRVPDDERKREHYIKRVIGLPGETVEISAGKVWIDGAVLEDDVYGKEAINRDFGPVTVPKGEVFVLGDNRNDSNDSRRIGTISGKRILGRVLVRFWPLNAMRKF